MNPTPRVAVIAIDGADRETLERHVANGRMPCVAAVMRRARAIEVRTQGELFLSSTWPCFASGVSAANHGIHAFRPFRSGTLDIVETEELRVPTPFWETAVRAGLRASVLDVPFCAPPQPDAQLAGLRFLEWGPHPAARPAGAYPVSLMRAIVDRRGPHPCPEDDALLSGVGDARAMLERLCAAARLRAEVVGDLVDGHAPELLVTVFSEAHTAAHQFLNLEVPGHPCHDRALAAALGPAPLSTVYEAIDAAIGAILAKLPAETTVLLTCLGGVRVTYGGSLLLGDVLVRLGLTRPALGASGRAARSLERVRALVPSALRRRLRKWLPARVRARNLHARFRASIDWTATRAVALPWSYDGYLRVNQRGREPLGVVAPGAERDALLTEIEHAVRALRIAGTGEPAAADVVRAQDAHPGRAAAELPDLMVLWRNHGPLDAVESPALGRIENRERGARPAHTSGGVVFAHGPGIAGGATLAGARDVDLGPTVLALLGVPAPAGLDGAALAELLGPT